MGAPPPDRLLRGLEFTALFVAPSLALWAFPDFLRGILILMLVVLGGLTLTLLLVDRSFDRGQLGNLEGLGRELPGIVLRCAIGAVLMIAVAATWSEVELFGFPRERTRLWAIVMVGYPFLSVYPQELFFRTLLFHRYAALFRSTPVQVAASAVTFCIAHLFFDHWLAPVMCLGGGFLFARTYARSRSTLACSVEHAIWGDLIWTIGFGRFFYHGPEL